MKVSLKNKTRYKNIYDLPDDLRNKLYGKPYENIFSPRLRFSFGSAGEDLCASIVCLATGWAIFTGDPFGQKDYFAPILLSAIVYGVSYSRHRRDLKKKTNKWQGYCQGFLDQLNERRGLD